MHCSSAARRSSFVLPDTTVLTDEVEERQQLKIL